MPEWLFSPKGLLCLWLAAANLWAFALMGFDKARARRQGRRVNELTLLCLPLLGGTVGALLGMYLFRHKTRHRQFSWGLPLLLLAQLGAAWFLLRR